MRLCPYYLRVVPKKRAIVSVINDLVTDQRVNKTCLVLHDYGYDVLLVGRRKKDSPDLSPRIYKTLRLSMFFEKGVAFYFFFNLRLLFLLLFKKADLLVSNDLDTLTPNFIVSKLKNIPLIYDTHEIFTEVPELQSSGLKKRIWKSLERLFIPRLKYFFTVNQSISNWYYTEYGNKPLAIRNVPMKASRMSHNIPVMPSGKIIILQGSGININRGAEEAVDAMALLPDYTLLIIGSGDVIDILKAKALSLSTGNVIFYPRMELSLLHNYTRQAHLGLSLDKPDNLNYLYSLPNKIFDYIHAAVPVLASDLPEVSRVIKTYNVGDVIEEITPQGVASKISEMLTSPDYNTWKENTLNASRELCWENESIPLRNALVKINAGG